MATAIHHGPPGSYKSFTLVQRIAIPELKAGRTIITNIRDFDDLDRIKAAYPGEAFDDKAKIIHLKDTEANRLKLAKFFHWAPPGALILIDEGQRIYPKRRDFKLEALDHYTPVEGEAIEALRDKHGDLVPRPEDIWTAFDMQRHWNWDLYISTPNIDKIHDFIRQVADWGYRHRSLDGVLPWMKGTWYEHQHDPEFSGKSPSHCVGVPTKYKVDRRAYHCYSSTATGAHSETKTGRSIFQDPKLRLIALVLVGVLSWAGYNLHVKLHTPKVSEVGTAAAAGAAGPAGSAPVHAQPPASAGSGAAPVKAEGPKPIYTLIEKSGDAAVFLVFEGARRYKLTSEDLIRRGKAVLFIAECRVAIVSKGSEIDASCDTVPCRIEAKTPEKLVRRECDLEAPASERSASAPARPPTTTAGGGEGRRGA